MEVKNQPSQIPLKTFFSLSMSLRLSKNVQITGFVLSQIPQNCSRVIRYQNTQFSKIIFTEKVMDLFDFLCVDVYLPGQSSCKILALYSQRSPRYVRFCFLRRVNPSAGPKVKIHLKPLKKCIYGCKIYVQGLLLCGEFIF